MSSTFPLLHGKEFVELTNFLPKRGRDFHNTCFIAVVANLRHLLTPVQQQISHFTWIELVNFVRQQMRDDRSNLRFSSRDGNGQHDAADLLSEFLATAPRNTFGTRISNIKYMLCCERHNEISETLPMIVLTLPSDSDEHSLHTLIQFYEAVEQHDRLECDFCSVGTNKHYFLGSMRKSIRETVDDKLVFRFNRYSADERRSDRILLDSSIALGNGVHYNLEAILQHQSDRSGHGHYIIFVLVAGRWEKRDDGRVTRTNIRYEPSNV